MKPVVVNIMKFPGSGISWLEILCVLNVVERWKWALL
jgi:hypothetical protein